MNDKLLIICEGKTDVVYLKCALEILHKDFSELIKSQTDYKIKFFGYKQSLRNILKLSDGAGSLNNFMNSFEKNSKVFKKISKHPVILIMDNDDGIKNNEKLKKFKKEQNNNFKPYIHVHKNLYVLLVPSIKDQGCIESLFDEKIFKQKLNGKSFSPANKIDDKKEFGKHIFSQKIKANRHSINFERFRVVFKAIIAIQEDYENHKNQ